MKEIVDSAFDKSLEQVGYVDPTIVSEHILFQTSELPRSTKQRIEHIVRFFPTHDYVYPDVYTFIPAVLKEENAKLDIWTDDYLDRIASSGIGQVRRDLDEEQRKRFGIRSDRHDKLSILTDVFNESRHTGMHVVIVDDREENLLKAEEIAEDVGVKETSRFIFLNRRNGKTLNGFFHTDSLDNVQAISEEPSHWLVDFNGVCIDDRGYTEERRRAIVREIDIYRRVERSSE